MHPGGLESGQTVYDTVAYPTAVFAQTHPSHLAVMAHLHGLTPPPIETARVLDIGGGDGMNLLAIAAAYPRGSFTGFDLAPTVVERGRRRAEAAGLANVRLEVLDILDAAEALPGPFDYVVAHGVYAWVPEPVRDALIAYIGRVLTPEGIAFMSYNALPGGHFRMAVRDLMLHYVTPDMNPDTRLRTARRVLEDFAAAPGGEEPVPAAFRHQAKATLNQIDGLLFHDELSEIYAPQLLSTVAAAAEQAGLRWLGDAGRARLMDGFLPEERPAEADEQAQIVRLTQERDFLEVRFFRRSLFVTAEARPARRFDPARLRSLWAAALCEAIPGGAFRGEGGEEFLIRDAALHAAFAKLVELRPDRLLVGDIVQDPDQLTAFMQLFDRGSLALHAGPAPFAVRLPGAPAVSPLARAMIGDGLETICTLDHSALTLEDPVLRAFLGRLDGSLRGEAIDEAAARSGFADSAEWRTAAQIALHKALIVKA